MKSEVHNIDCVEFMRTLPTKYFDLAIVDPPYGIGAGSKKFINKNTVNKKAASFYKDKDWDIKPISLYFEELERVSKKYIIWGGNYFVNELKIGSRCFIVWDKKTGANSYADCELALTNFDSNARIYTQFWLGAHANNGTERIHPTEKPIALYTWLLQNYAKQPTGIKELKEFIVFDSHMGSQSSRIAAHDMGFDYVGCELDKEYFDAGNRRFKEHITKAKLFTPEQLKVTQTSLL